MPPRNKCPCCKAGVLNADMGLQCEICEEWSHANCMKISDVEYQFLKDHKGIDWFCGQCKKTIASVIKTSTGFKDKQDKLDKEVDEIKESLQCQVDKIEKELKSISVRVAEIDKNVKDNTEKVLSTDTKIETAIEAKLIDSLAKPSFASVVAKEVDNKFSQVSVDVTKVQQSIEESKRNVLEEKDREARGNNIIIYRVPEGTSKEDTNKNDKTFCMELCSDVLGIDSDVIDFKALFRLGRFETGKVRPILIQVREKTLKNQIMESLYKLRGADDKFKNVSITHDLTQKERVECKALIEEAKKKQIEETGEFIWRVRGLPGQLKLTKIKKRQV
jgi:chaperonin cofactor prefoldin